MNFRCWYDVVATISFYMRVFDAVSVCVEKFTHHHHRKCSRWILWLTDDGTHKIVLASRQCRFCHCRKLCYFKRQLKNGKKQKVKTTSTTTMKTKPAEKSSHYHFIICLVFLCVCKLYHIYKWWQQKIFFLVI